MQNLIFSFVKGIKIWPVGPEGPERPIQPVRRKLSIKFPNIKDAFEVVNVNRFLSPPAYLGSNCVASGA